MDYLEIKSILTEQKEDFLNKDEGIIREKLLDVGKYLEGTLAVIISGVRRVGKSTLLRQVANKYYDDKDFYYINFEDERLLEFDPKEFNKVLEIMVELYGDKKVLLIDEIQNIKSWELFVRRLTDNGYKIFITGSNADLLSKELGSRLTGRYIELNLFPFSFPEYLSFNGLNIDLTKTLSTIQRAKVIDKYNSYMVEGGIPASLKIKDFNFNQTLYQNIVYRDIIARYKIESEVVIKSIAHHLANNISGLIAFNKLKQYFHLGSITTVKNYISYLENAWLFFTVNIYDPSIKRQQIAAKKIYAIDIGMIRNIGFSFSEKYGQILENNVFLDLKRIFDQIYYYKTHNNLEVDFYVPAEKLLVQSCYDLNNKETKQREVEALLQAMKEVKTKRAFILNLKQEEDLKINGNHIHILPAYKFLQFLKTKPFN